MFRVLLVLLASVLVLSLSVPAYAALPPVVTAIAKTPLSPAGSGQYRKLGFNIYHATLWAPSGVWSPDAPYAIQIIYARSLSKETMVDAVASDIRKQNTIDGPTMKEWEAKLNETLPPVKTGDEIIGLSVPGGPSRMFFNGGQIVTIDDPQVSDTFFNIWLGPVADKTLRAQLLGISE